MLLRLFSVNEIKTFPPRPTSHLLQEPLQPLPRMLMGGRQQPLGSSSAVGALVPYTATSTKVGALAAAAASQESRTRADLQLPALPIKCRSRLLCSSLSRAACCSEDWNSIGSLPQPLVRRHGRKTSTFTLPAAMQHQRTRLHDICCF